MPPACVLALAALLGAGCRQDMHDQPRYEPLEASDFFADGRSARPQVPGTVARGQLRADELLYTGKSGGVLADRFPFPIRREDLDRGRERYEIFCSPCHDRAGYGRGMVVRRGFQRAASFHLPEVRAKPAGHYFDVMTNGLGAMAPYAAQVPVRDRWRIAAYIRVLQLSQGARAADLPAGDREKLEALWR